MHRVAARHGRADGNGSRRSLSVEECVDRRVGTARDDWTRLSIANQWKVLWGSFWGCWGVRVGSDQLGWSWGWDWGCNWG